MLDGNNCSSNMPSGAPLRVPERKRMASKKNKKAFAYRRVLLKLSGEALQSSRTGESLDPQALEITVRKISNVWKRGVELAIVVGGGNIFRGLPASRKGFDRTAGDYMGMLATVINALALQASLEAHGIPARVMSAIPMSNIAEPFIRRRALKHLDKRRVVIFAAGTGNPFFTTDSAAALRASEIGADVLLKATKVDGIYSADPVAHPDAKRFRDITYREALARELKIMDAAAFSLCMENRIPIIVFDFFADDALVRVLDHPTLGTLVHA
jgi:uridylate kinase